MINKIILFSTTYPPFEDFQSSLMFKTIQLVLVIVVLNIDGPNIIFPICVCVKYASSLSSAH